MNIRDLERAIAPLHRRVMLAIGRAVLRQADDAGGAQRLQVSLLAGETRGEVERFQDYGFSSHPIAGAEAVVVSVGGNRDNPVAVVVADRRSRPQGLAAGEVCIHSHIAGQRITLKADGSILIQSAAKVRLEAPTVEVVGAVTVTGDVVAGGISLRTHTHPGVTTGGGSTGAPT